MVKVSLNNKLALENLITRSIHWEFDRWGNGKYIGGLDIKNKYRFKFQKTSVRFERYIEANKEWGLIESDYYCNLIVEEKTFKIKNRTFSIYKVFGL